MERSLDSYKSRDIVSLQGFDSESFESAVVPHADLAATREVTLFTTFHSHHYRRFVARSLLQGLVPSSQNSGLFVSSFTARNPKYLPL